MSRWYSNNEQPAHLIIGFSDLILGFIAQDLSSSHYNIPTQEYDNNIIIIDAITVGGVSIFYKD